MSGHDLVIRNGRIVDGSGAAAFFGDVAIDGDRITAVSRRSGVLSHGRREIDAAGRLVTPGFVDVHTHYDAQASWDPWLTPSSWHGVTTVVGGNCGVGFAPAAPDRHEWLIALMEGVEDIPGAAMAEGISWEWESFPEYLDALDRRRYVIDHGYQVAHGPVRGYVMGERGARNEPATADDLTAMHRIVAEALRAGALGVSSSQTTLHKSKDGEYVPGTFVDAAELFALADAAHDAGHGVLQFALEHRDVPDTFATLRELVRRSGRTLSFNLGQADQSPEVWRESRRLTHEARTAGLDIVMQAPGRSIGVLECLDGSLHPFVTSPIWRELRDLPRAERLARLRFDERVRSALLDDAPRETGSPSIDLLTRAWHRMYPVGVGDIDYEPNPDTDSLAARSAQTGVAPQRLALDALCDHDGEGMLYVPLLSYSYGDLSMQYELHADLDATRMGLSDGGAHCGSICDGGMPTFMLTYWTRDRVRGPRLGLEHVIHRQTRQTAALFALHDRGLVAPGYKADLNVIDYDALTFGNAHMAYDFPTGARRLVQRASGYVATVCSGAVIVEDDEFTGALPGRLLRGPHVP
jgi:N-acyl-D-amino-acid deacylase